MKHLLIFVLLSVAICHGTLAQTDESPKHYLGFSTQYHQIKEAANYGLVNQGLNLGMNYSYHKQNGKRVFSYTPNFAFGPNYRNGLGLNWHFRLVDFTYGFQICKRENRTLYLGGYGAINYLLQLYPEMQSGHMYWFTTMEVGPKFYWNIKLNERLITISAGNSLMGFTSRPIAQTEQYYYSLNLGDIIKDINSNLEFGSYNKFNHTFFEIDYTNQSRSKIIIGYAFEYFGYYDAPTYSYMTHSIILKWALGK